MYGVFHPAWKKILLSDITPSSRKGGSATASHASHSFAVLAPLRDRCPLTKIKEIFTNINLKEGKYNSEIEIKDTPAQIPDRESDPRLEPGPFVEAGKPCLSRAGFFGLIKSQEYNAPVIFST